MARDSVALKSSNASEALDLDRIVALATGAIVMAYLNEVLAGDEISADQRIGIDAGIVVLGNERSFTVRAKEFHNDIGGTARVDLIPAVARCGKAEQILFAEFTDGCGGAQVCVDFELDGGRCSPAGLRVHLGTCNELFINGR